MVQNSTTLSRCVEEIKAYTSKIVVITDENVYRLYEDFFSGFTTLCIPAGEQSKTREMKITLEDELLTIGVDRDGLLVGVGGGVVCDLTGFLAATYMRGIDYFLVPTSLLAMVDAAIGGKTAVNTPMGKNLIGAFHLPKKIFQEPLFLQTLPEQEMREGFIEIVKYGIACDYELFLRIQSGERDFDFLVERSQKIKGEIVREDLFERGGRRRVLNFGHTVGHALENISEYKMSHGEAVWNGLLMESFLNREKGLIHSRDLEDIVSVLLREDVRLKTLEGINKKDLYEVMRRDKKSVRLNPCIIGLDGIGKSSSTFTVTLEEVGEALRWIYAL